MFGCEVVGTASLEEFGYKLSEVDAPVAPDVSSLSFEILVRKVPAVEIRPQVGIVLIEEIGLADAYSEQSGVPCKELVYFLLTVGIDVL